MLYERDFELEFEDLGDFTYWLFTNDLYKIDTLKVLLKNLEPSPLNRPKSNINETDFIYNFIREKVRFSHNDLEYLIVWEEDEDQFIALFEVA